ncbi:hypothetical protein [Sinomonas halotolerans]|uniref:Integral membrane protein n=1 Tax=Sinomonas halotolerans TaxID=1644133 RepID=A0ABU9WXY5_9MICC
METVWSLVIVLIVAASAGFIVWASDRRHHAYGIMLPVGAAVAAASLAWTIAVAAGAGYTAGLTWMPWVLPMAAAVAAALASALVVGRRRVQADTEALTEILKR